MPTKKTVHSSASFANGPVRKVVTGRRRGVTGYVPSRKGGGLVPFESILERDLIDRMKEEAGIAAFLAQPETFRWRRDGRARRYTPDFLVVLDDGMRIYREVKPLSRLERDPSFGGRLADMVRECAERGAGFEIWTEENIRLGVPVRPVVTSRSDLPPSDMPQTFVREGTE